MSSNQVDRTNSEDLGPSEVEFALVLARIIDAVGNDEEQLRQTVYEITDLRHCLERLTAANGTFVSECKTLYSRGTLVLQLLSCFIVIVAIRLGTYRGFQAAAAKGLIRGQRVVLVGHRNDCALYARQLRKSGGGIQIDFCPVTSASERDKRYTIDWSMTSSVIERCRRLQPNSIILLVDKRHDDKTTSALATHLRQVPADLYAVPTHGAEFWLTARPGEIGGVPAFALAHRPLSISSVRSNGPSTSLRRWRVLLFFRLCCCLRARRWRSTPKPSTALRAGLEVTYQWIERQVLSNSKAA